MISFAAPLWLLGLALLPFLPRLRRRGKVQSLAFPSAGLVRASTDLRGKRRGKTLLWLRSLALALFLVALARPQVGLGEEEIEAAGIDIVIALDVSGSMAALDFKLDGKRATRLAVVQRVVEDFVDARPDDRIGLIAFAAQPWVVSPLTLDHDWLRRNLERIELGMVDDGTAIGSAIASSTNRLRAKDGRSAVVILLTDGVNNAGKISPLVAADAARSLGVKVHTILAGTTGEAPIAVIDAFGRERIVRARVEADPDTLRAVAERTNARFFHATDTESLEAVWAEIDEMERTTERLRRFEDHAELYPWPLGAALLLLGLEVLLAETRLRRLP
jgi:Ca-activated chloride channel family protein